jgi:hypothetical protein
MRKARPSGVYARFNSGVDMLGHSSLFQFRHGDHTCVFYRSEDALMEVLTPYVAEGLRRGELCFCVQKPHICTRLLSDLRLLGFDTADFVARGALDVRSEDEVYLPNGRFDPRNMMDMAMQSLSEALDRGFPALRGAGDLSWAVKGRNECEPLLEYEGIVNGYHPGRPLIGLCQYDANAFSPRMLDSVVRAHGLCVSDLLPSSPNYSRVSTHSGNFLLRHRGGQTGTLSPITMSFSVADPTKVLVGEPHPVTTAPARK